MLQDTRLFDLTVGENIRMGKLDARSSELVAAADSAEIHDLIAEMPGGYNAPVGLGGSRLSGGQRQRLALARALVRQPEVLLLDEATSALDPSVEAAIVATLDRLSAGRTVLSVTHRLGTIRDFDRIMVLDDGRLVEEGSHTALAAMGGVYAKMLGREDGLHVSPHGASATIDASWLANVELLRDLPLAQKQALAARARSRLVPAGADICTQGERGQSFYILAHGAAVVLRHQGEREVHLGSMHSGDTFGEVALIADTPRTATVRARVPCTVLTLSRSDLMGLLDDFPELMRELTLRAHQLAANPDPDKTASVR